MRASHRAVEAPRLCKGSPQGDERTGGSKGDFRRRSAALARAAERNLPGGRVGAYLDMGTLPRDVLLDASWTRRRPGAKGAWSAQRHALCRISARLAPRAAHLRASGRAPLTYVGHVSGTCRARVSDM